MNNIQRCGWGSSEYLLTYHDIEWGVPLHDDRLLFEFLILDGFQAGLSWEIVLKKRPAFRTAFDNFDPYKIVQYDGKKLEELGGNAGIIRNRLKIAAAVQNAAAFIRIQEEFGSFDAYIWQFVGGKPIINHWEKLSDIPTESPEAQKMSASLRSRGFKFTGPVICYAYMQAAGMVNDHITSCFRYQQLVELARL